MIEGIFKRHDDDDDDHIIAQSLKHQDSLVMTIQLSCLTCSLKLLTLLLATCQEAECIFLNSFQEYFSLCGVRGC